MSHRFPRVRYLSPRRVSAPSLGPFSRSEGRPARVIRNRRAGPPRTFPSSLNEQSCDLDRLIKMERVYGRQSDDPQELERKIDQATRIASRVNDQTTVERLRAWIEDMKQRLRRRLEARRTKQAISARAREIWEQNGCPVDRDLEFWLQAEFEINERDQQ